MADFGNSFDKLADTGMWQNVLVLFGGFLGATLFKNTIEGRVEIDIPDEAYGILIIAASAGLLEGEYQQFAVMGGGLYTVDKLAERFGIKSKVQGV
jgi:hypothetical protein